MTNQYRINRAGAFWLMEDGTRLAWDDDHNYFINPVTGEAYSSISEKSLKRITRRY